MSEPLRRTVFCDMSQGYAIFSDWAMVVTELGNCAEPFLVNQKTSQGGSAAGLVNFDPSNSITKINDIQNVDIRSAKNIFQGLHGGNQMPREGR